MRAGQADKIGAPRQQDGVDVVDLGDVADGHRGQPRLVADPVGKRCLEHPAIDKLASVEVWPALTSMMSAPAARHPCDLDGLRRGHAVIAQPVIGRDTDESGFAFPQAARMARKTSSGQRILFFQRPAVVVGPPVRDWADERGDEGNHARHAVRPCRNPPARPFLWRARSHRGRCPCRRASSRAGQHGRATEPGRRGDGAPAAGLQRHFVVFPGDLDAGLAARMADQQQIFAVVSRWTKSGQPPPSRLVFRRVQARAAQG